MASVSPPKPWERAGAGATGMCPGKPVIATLGTDDKRLEIIVDGTDWIDSCRCRFIIRRQSTYGFYTFDYDFYFNLTSTFAPSTTFNPLSTNLRPQLRRQPHRLELLPLRWRVPSRKLTLRRLWRYEQLLVAIFPLRRHGFFHVRRHGRHGGHVWRNGRYGGHVWRNGRDGHAAGNGSE